jgi:glycosyltransferase involved in cell wall biosynthesis
MRIGIDISQIVYQTGVSRYTAELVKSLVKLDRENQYVLYAGSLRQRPLIQAFAAQLPRKVNLVLSPAAPKIADWLYNRFNLPLKLQVDVFHASNWMLPAMACPVVTTIHDLTFLSCPQEHLPYYINVHRRHLNRAKNRAAAVIAVSQATKRELINQGLAAAKITVIYEAAGRIFKPLAAKRQPFVLSVGTREPRKNLKRLIEAWQKLNRKDLTLKIAGKVGWGERQRPVPGVELLGFVPDEELVLLYNQARVFVYPSLREGFGLPVLEAMACGCPVVASGVSSLPEIGGRAAVYVDPYSTASISQGIKTALQQGRRLRRLGLAQAKQFSWEKTARKTLKLYQEIYAYRR